MKIAERRFEYLKDKSVEEIKGLIEEAMEDLAYSEKRIDETKNYHEALDLRNDIMYDNDLIRACQKELDSRTKNNVK